MTDPNTEESGSKLRDQMVAWRKIAVNSAVSQFKFVKPEDLDGVEPDQIVTKAQEVEAARKEASDALLREALVSRGVAVESDLETALSALTGSSVEPPVKDDSAAARLASLGSLGGVPTRQKVEVPADAKGKIVAGLAAKATK